MTIHLGSVPASSIIYIPFHTFDSNGASITLTGLLVGDIEIYKNGSVTQRSSDAGYVLLDTDGIDFDGITGLHGFSIDLADNTDAGFYAAGSFYMVAVSAVTVDTRTVNFWAATFFIGPVAANVTQWLGTAAATPTVAGVPEVDVTHLVGVAQSATDLKDFADDGYDPATNKVQGVVLTDTLTTYTGNTPQTGDNFARLGAPAGASVSADIAAIEAQTDDIGVAGAGLTNIPAGAASPEVLVTTTITNLVSQQLFDLVAGSADSNAYNGHTVVITDASTPTQKAVGEVLAHSGATISLKEDPAIFTIANGDTISILADRSLKPNVHGRMLDLTTGGAAGIDWGNMENKTTTNALTGTTVGTATNLTNAPTAGDLTAAMKASVNAEVVDALNVDTYAEIGQETPAATQTIRKMIAYLYKAFRNRKTQTATTLSLYADDATTVDQKATISDDGTTYSHGEIGTGP